MLGMKHRRLTIEVVGCPRADGGRVSSDGRQNKCLLTEVQHAEPVGDESRLSKRKDWDGSKMGGTHIPIGGSAGNSSEAKRVVSLEPAMPKFAERWAIR